MARVKGGIQSSKRRRSILKATKGYRMDRSAKKRSARDATYHAQLHAFAHRKDKKADYRALFIARINAAIKPHGMNYSRFMSALKKKGVVVDRKILATLAQSNEQAFGRIVASVK